MKAKFVAEGTYSMRNEKLRNNTSNAGDTPRKVPGRITDDWVQIADPIAELRVRCRVDIHQKTQVSQIEHDAL